jgi:hypothetical protein
MKHLASFWEKLLRLITGQEHLRLIDIFTLASNIITYYHY